MYYSLTYLNLFQHCKSEDKEMIIVIGKGATRILEKHNLSNGVNVPLMWH